MRLISTRTNLDASTIPRPQDEAHQCVFRYCHTEQSSEPDSDVCIRIDTEAVQDVVPVTLYH